MKRLLSIILSIMMLCSVIPATGLTVYGAEDTTENIITSGSCGENTVWNFDTENSTLTISGTGKMNNFSEAPWFSFRNSIEEVIIEDGVTKIGEKAFNYCEKMNKLTITKDVTTIARNAFNGCCYIENVYISDLAAWCNISFGNEYANPIYYGANLCLNGEPIKDLVIPDGVSTIKKYAFFKFKNITSVSISKDVKTIGEHAFWKCNELKKVYISDLSSWCNITFKNIYSNPLHCTPNLYLNNQQIKELDVTDNIKKISNYAFVNCINFTSVKIGTGVETIGEDAFSGCTNIENLYITDLSSWCAIKFNNLYSNPSYYTNNLYLNDELIKDLIIPDDVTKIGDYAFYKNTNLTNVKIGKNVKIIGSYAFEECTNISSVFIPESVTNIYVAAFYNCKSLKAVYITSIEAWCNILMANYANPLNFAHNLYLNNELLTEVVIPKGCTEIKSFTFQNCTSLKSVTIPNGVTRIGHYAFEGCTNLENISLPDNATYVGLSAFNNCTSIKNVYAKDLTSWCKIDFADYTSNPLTYAENLYFNNKLTNKIVIPDNFEIIGRSFGYFKGLTELKITNGVKYIGPNAFQGCVNLTDIYFPESITNISNSAFYDCNNIKKIIISNPDCYIANGGTFPQNATIYGYKNSTAHLYAKEYSRKFIEIDSTTEHIWNIGVINRENCDKEGNVSYTCLICDETITKIFNPGEHIKDEGVIHRDKCDIEGIITYTCLLCSDKFNEVAPPIEHTWDDGVTTRENCETEGTITYTCTICSENKTETVPIGEHILDNGVVTIKPTCTSNGVETFTCKVCKITTTKVVLSGGHRETIDKSVLPTCTNKGLTQGKHCTVCNVVTVKQKELPALGHTEVSGTSVAPTCTESGYIGEVHCSVCKTLLSPKVILNKTGHKKVIDKAIAPTCIKPGLTEGEHCSVCNEVFIPQKKIDVMGHSIKTVGKKSATYFSKGYSGDKICKICNATINKGKVKAKLKLKTPKSTIKAGNKKLTVKYKKVTGATGFQVRYKFSNSTLTITYNTKKSISKTISNMKKGTYKIYIRAFVKQGTKKAYSNWTKAKTIKVK